MRLKTQDFVTSICLAMGLAMGAIGCGGSQDSNAPQGQVEAISIKENRCPVVTETRLTAEADLLVMNSVKSRVTNSKTQAYINQTLAGQYRNVVQIGQIVSKNTMSPIDSVQAQDLRSSAAASAASLKEVSGLGLDEAYLDWQIGEYERALDTLNNRWLKMATTPDLVAFLHQLQGFLGERLDAARSVRQGLR